MGTPGRARRGAVLLAASSIAASSFAGSSCSGTSEPQVTISAVMPHSAYSDSRINLVIQGGPFRPIYDIDTSAGRATTELGAFTAFLAPTSGSGTAFAADSLMWLSTSQLAAGLQEGVFPGAYDVEVRDPRGGLATLPGAFVSLGSDETAPVVRIVQPLGGTIVNAGAEVPVAFEADDGLGYLASMEWKVSTSDVDFSGTCPLAPDAQRATCRFVFVAPEPAQNGQPLAVVVWARDTKANPSQAQATLAIGLPPLAGTFAPDKGSAEGGTQLVVHGRNFISGTQVLVGGALLQPDGGDVVSDTLIQGMIPAHDPGLVTVAVRTGAVSVALPGTFEYVGRPEARAIAPTSGPSAGCTPVTIVGKNFRESATRVWFGSDMSSASPLRCPTFVSQTRIEGFTPPGAGAVSVFVADPVGSVNELPLAFTYLDLDMPDAAAPPACPCAAGSPP